MYKNLSAAGEQGKFKTENVIFNVQPSVAMRKNTAYYVQRN